MGGIDVFGAGCAGDVGGLSTICTCGNILELAGSETTSSREREIETMASLRDIDEWGRGFEKVGHTCHSNQLQLAQLSRRLAALRWLECGLLTWRGQLNQEAR